MSPDEIVAHAKKQIEQGSSMMVLTRSRPRGKIGDKTRMFGRLGGPMAQVLGVEAGRIILGCPPRDVIIWFANRADKETQQT